MQSFLFSNSEHRNDVRMVEPRGGSCLACHDGITQIHPFFALSCTDCHGGDATVKSISAASILAKVHRDRLMRDLHHEYPAYRWVTNVGYPTREHYAALTEHGPTPYHRRSFRLA